MIDEVKKILVSEEQIQARIGEMAAQINKDYEGESVVLVGLLNGSIPFLADLFKQIKIKAKLDFMDVSSYHGTTTSNGEVRILKDLARQIAGENVLVIEDIIDTGKTLKVVKRILENRHPKSLKIVSLLDKPAGRKVAIEADYVGFEIENEFVIGYGLDYDEYYRNLPYIGVLKEECYM
jgi:hypoxanthine phosphoribosyltransferase